MLWVIQKLLYNLIKKKINDSYRRCFCSSNHFSLTAFCHLSGRTWVPLGTKAFCRGRSRTSAEKQQTDDRQQLSGRTLRGSLLLCTLGEHREERLWSLLPLTSLWGKGHGQQNRAGTQSGNGKDRGRGGWRRGYCSRLFTLTVLNCTH